jgi:carboxypeptidase Taq
MAAAFDRLQNIFADFHAIGTANQILGWDRQVMMPQGGAAARTRVTGHLTRMAHEILTGNELSKALSEAKAEAESDEEKATIRVLQRDVDTATKIPIELVIAKSKVSNDAYEVWKKAKAESNFSLLAPYLKELFDIARSTAESLGYTDHVYDPLIDMYEEGATQKSASDMFEAIKSPIVELVKQISKSGKPINDDPLRGGWDLEAQRKFAQGAASAIGFDFRRGRLDIAPNAFCSSSSSDDVRMTTRASDHLKGIVSSSLHEMGHGLYEQGVSPRFDGTPLGGGVSLAVHESQSRLWENIVGRSEGFWTFFAPSLHAALPDLSGFNGRELSHMLCKVEPTFIRVGADELTYNLHILIRFELEVEILTGAINIADLPEAWNHKYETYLGIRPPSDALGCLQDVHWSRGSIGYFPTYSMGNLIGAQIWEKLCQDLGDPEPLVASGNFAPILGWLSERIYQPGQSFTPKDLVTQVTGKPMQPDAWLRYAKTRYQKVYDLN